MSCRRSRLGLRLLSEFNPARFNLVLAFVTTIFLISGLLDFPETTFALARKFWSKKDLGDSRVGSPKASSSDAFVYRLRLGQFTSRASRFVFDPGGVAFTLDCTGPGPLPKQLEPHRRNLGDEDEQWWAYRRCKPNLLIPTATTAAGSHPIQLLATCAANHHHHHADDTTTVTMTTATLTAAGPPNDW
ncbi:hypothetical protein H4582DRAFT_109966 [Lactarius indigo]|nr:hypothetical protein H4582DRAFT_109966 [Lactarius indigo]